MWIVRLALRRPYTFVVLAMLIVLMGVMTILRMPTDMYPEINIPVVAAIWNYNGLPPTEMEGRITSIFERATTTTVSGIEHLESLTLGGTSVIKIFMQPGSSVDGAVAQVAAVSQPILRQMPPGAIAPLVMGYSASNVPVLQLGLTSPTLPEQQVYDLTTNFLRTGLATVQGAQVPLPYGGKVRAVVVDIDPQKLFAWGISPSDVTTAVNQQNVILPSGTAKIGSLEYNVLMNGSPDVVAGLNDLPVKKVNGAMVYLRDVAHVRDGYVPQTSMVLTNGTKGALLPVLKSQGASTLDVVSRTRAALPGIQATLPPDLQIKPIADQSVFVKGAVVGVVREAAIAAGLTGIMMLLFLGSWRSTVVVMTSIPLSLLVSIIVLNWFGQTINLMTLGVMALAVGILVDDATVEVENFHRQHAMGKPALRAILDGAAEIAVPALVSTLCICIVFLPVTLIAGVAKSLFIPLALAVVFAMLTSYFLSRTLVPTLVRYLLANEKPGGETGGRNPLAWMSSRGGRGFERLREAYGRALQLALHHRKVFVVAFAGVVAISLSLIPLLGRDFFPAVDAGQIRLHVRAPAATRIEDTQRLFGAVEERVRAIVPPGELDTITDNIGVPVSGINLVLGDPSMISSADGEMLVSLTPKHGPTAGYVKALRSDLREKFPQAKFFFLAADSSQTAPNFWMDPKTAVQYSVAVQTPQVRIDSIQAVELTPLLSSSGPVANAGSFLTPITATSTRPELLSNVASVSRITGPTNITHYNIARTVDVQANVEGADLGSVSSAVQKLVAETRAHLPRGSTIKLTGQTQAMNASFSGLGSGIVVAIVLVYLLLVVNFQSWMEPLIILMALPGTLAGIVWGLFLTGTTLSGPALMGTLMSIGVATANSILVVTFAIERLREGADVATAALEAGRTRLRPVIMTATAMILGMLPMSLGLGDGGEQNAPLGRAVIGGLLFATVSTLFFVPVVLSAIGYRPAAQADDPELREVKA